MIKGINVVTDEKGRGTAVLLDLVVFKKEGFSAEQVLASLGDLQQLIDQAVAEKTADTWDKAKDKLKNLKG